jgi:hypothetical protein
MVTTRANPTAMVAENVLNREFEAEAPNQKWAADVTYIKTKRLPFTLVIRPKMGHLPLPRRCAIRCPAERRSKSGYRRWRGREEEEEHKIMAKVVNLLSPAQRAKLLQIPDDFPEREIVRYYALSPEDLDIIAEH